MFIVLEKCVTFLLNPLHQFVLSKIQSLHLNKQNKLIYQLAWLNTVNKNKNRLTKTSQIFFNLGKNFLSENHLFFNTSILSIHRHICQCAVSMGLYRVLSKISSQQVSFFLKLRDPTIVAGRSYLMVINSKAPQASLNENIFSIA